MAPTCELGALPPWPQRLLQLCEANSLRSRSFSGKLTKVVSLLARILASEKRFRSGGGARQGGGEQRGTCKELPPRSSPTSPIYQHKGYGAPGSWGTSGC